MSRRYTEAIYGPRDREEQAIEISRKPRCYFIRECVRGKYSTRPVRGYPVQLPGELAPVQCFTHKDSGQWWLSEVETGASLIGQTGGDTRQAAAQRFLGAGITLEYAHRHMSAVLLQAGAVPAPTDDLTLAANVKEDK